MELTKERKGQIALALWKDRIRREGISSLKPNEVKRELGNMSVATGISIPELKQFLKDLLAEVLDEALAG